MMHLFTNFQMASTLVGEPSTFQHEVEFIHAMPALLWIEISLWSAIGFHAALGLVFTFTGKVNYDRYKYQGNLRYTLQRVTGILALIFIFLHIATLRWRWSFGGWFTPFFTEGVGPDGKPVLLAQATTAMALQHAWWVVALYVIGVYSAIFHWCNGLWTSAITWGLTISVPAQRRWGYVCAVIGITLGLFAAGGIGGALAYKPNPDEIAATQLKAGVTEKASMTEAVPHIEKSPKTEAVKPEVPKADAPKTSAISTENVESSKLTVAQ